MTQTVPAPPKANSFNRKLISPMILGSVEGVPSATRTMPTPAPAAWSAPVSAAVNVARPHAVGGKVLSTP